MCCCSKFFICCHQIIHCTQVRGSCMLHRSTKNKYIPRSINQNRKCWHPCFHLSHLFSKLFPRLLCTRICHKMDKTIWLHVLWQRTTIFLTSSSSINRQKATMFYSRLLPHITCLCTCNEIMPHKTWSRQSRNFYLESMLFYTGHWV